MLYHNPYTDQNYRRLYIKVGIPILLGIVILHDQGLEFDIKLSYLKHYHMNGNTCYHLFSARFAVHDNNNSDKKNIYPESTN